MNENNMNPYRTKNNSNYVKQLYWLGLIPSCYYVGILDGEFFYAKKCYLGYVFACGELYAPLIADLKSGPLNRGEHIAKLIYHYDKAKKEKWEQWWKKNWILHWEKTKKKLLK